MITWSNIISLLLLTVTIFSLLRIWRSDFTYRAKWFFSSVRVLMGIVLIFMVLEPVFHIRYLAKSTAPLPILVDASASMSHFAADSVVTGIRRGIDSIAALHTASVSDTRWFLFGDSLRVLKKDSVKFSDGKSYFPDFTESSVLNNSKEMIIISDGHWSNSELPFKAADSRIFWYVPLTLHHQPPSLSIQAPDTISSSENRPVKLFIQCKGVTTDTTHLSLTLTDKDTIATLLSTPIPEGTYNYTFTVAMPDEKPGYHVYNCSVFSTGDSLRTSRKVLYRVTPEKYRCSFISSRPSMDERFLRLAVDRNSSFIKNGGTGKTDVYFVFNNAKVPDAIKEGLPVFIGTPPLQFSTVSSDSLSIAFPGDAIVNPFTHLPLLQLPPIEMSIPAKLPFQPSHTYLTAENGNNSFPLLFSGSYHKQQAVFCSITNFWKWDFLPLSHGTGESNNFSFSESLLKLVESVLISTTNDTLLAFSAGTTTSSDSIRMLCIAPYIAFKDSVQLSVRFLKSGKNAVPDTSILLKSSYFPLRGFRLPPLPEGEYTQICSLTVRDKSFLSHSTITVTADNSEHMVNDQNESLLRQYGSPLSLEKDLLTSPFFSEKVARNTGNRESSGLITIQRSWWLLGILLFLFFLEIAVRKFKYYD